MAEGVRALYRFQIPGEPVAKGRPRARVLPSGHAGVYTPKRTASFEQKVRDCALAAGICEPLEGALQVHVVAHWEWPRSKWRKREPLRPCWRGDGPDADNVAKAICDALNGVAYLDDRQVARLVVEKHRAAQGEPARTVVVIETLG